MLPFFHKPFQLVQRKMTFVGLITVNIYGIYADTDHMQAASETETGRHIHLHSWPALTTIRLAINSAGYTSYAPAI